MTTTTYACAVKIGREYEATEQLQQICDWAWCAKHMKAVRVGPRNARKREWSEAPLWPGYVFATMTAQQFFIVQTRPQMKKLMHQMKLPLGEGEARRLAQAVLMVDDQLEADKRAVRRLEAPAVAFSEGQEVDVLEGILGGHRAHVMKIQKQLNGEHMAQVEIEGGGLPVWVPAADLKAAE